MRVVQTLERKMDVGNDHGSEENFDIHEEVESILEGLFQDIQDKVTFRPGIVGLCHSHSPYSQDTIVRWSAAKGIARISEHLPLDYIEQVLDTIIALFSIHSVAAASLYDMPTIAESTWHGSCLACAEMIRRDLIPSKMVLQVIEWMSKVSYGHFLAAKCLIVRRKALLFDIRKGSHSIGSNVRDAAAYALWALARVGDQFSIAPHAIGLSRRLVTVALFDREVSIRRAASAAFQEHVGRLVCNASEASINRCYSSSRTCFHMASTSCGKRIFMPLVSGEMPF
jgi:hypothetical protein